MQVSTCQQEAQRYFGQQLRCKKNDEKELPLKTFIRLTLNASKCEAMKFGLRGQQCITLMIQKVLQKVSCKYLGLHIDGKMTFRDHIDYAVKKLNQFSGLVYKVRHLYPSKCLLLFYNLYAESVIR